MELLNHSPIPPLLFPFIPPSQADNEAGQKEIRQLRDRVEASERSADALRRELGELSGLQGHSHAELHQTRLQMAQANMQLSQATLAVREGEATWAQEKEQLRHSAEVRAKMTFGVIEEPVQLW